MHKLPQPVKLWYLSSFFRRERPQKGRFRQFWQVGAEAIGSDDPAVDAESILLLAELLEALGLPRRAAADRLARHAGDAARLPRGAAGATCARTRTQLPPEVVARIDLNPLRAFDSDHPGTQRVMADAPRLLDRLDDEDREHFATVRALLDGVGQAYEVDTTLVRGLDYYTRTVFEFTSDALGAQSGVGGGGRYDGLIEQIGGPPTPGIGWASGVERMLLTASAMPRRAAPPLDLYVAYADAGAARRRVPARRRRAPRRPRARDSNSPAARSRASSSRPTARAPATLPSSATRAPR